MTTFDSEHYVYLDWAATAPLCEAAAEAMRPFLEPGAANLALGMNANSLHSPGRGAYQALEASRKRVAELLGASRPSEVIFTSGATESDNTAILGLAEAVVKKRRQSGKSTEGLHIVSSAIEHEAVLAPLARLESQGWRVTRLNPDSRGFIGVDALRSALTSDTVLVSLQMANSEVGSVQPISQLAQAAHDAGALFHTDAVQALGKMPLDVNDLGVDAASFAAHKIGGPKGVGALYCKARTPFSPFMFGGGQEEGRRSGTQNVCGIAGFTAALEVATSNLAEEAARQRALRDYVYARISELPGVEATVSVQEGDESFLPNIIHMLVDGFESETLVLRLDQRGFGVSGGSACSSHSLEPSGVLRAMGISQRRAFGALRVSFGHLTVREDMDRFVAALQDCLNWR